MKKEENPVVFKQMLIRDVPQDIVDIISEKKSEVLARNRDILNVSNSDAIFRLIREAKKK